MKNYVQNILNVLILGIGLNSFMPSKLYSQTCCSGGVPLSGNIGFEGADRGALQMELSYDLNYLATLKDGSDVYTDESRLRITQSILLKTGYSITRRVAVDALFTYVGQGRTITYQGNVNQVSTNGIGDAVIITKVILSRLNESGTELQLGAGPKIPLGRSNLADDRGITLNADLQPGSGSWDLITWGYYVRQLSKRPSFVVSARIIGRFNGSNQSYLGSETYHFGNSLQLYLGGGDRFNIKNRIISASLSVGYRHALADKINDNQLDNTGGKWVNIIPSIGWSIGPNSLIQLIPEIPVFSKVEGIQLTPSFRVQAGFYHTFRRKKNVESKKYIL